ncbi:hypothetical protein [Actinoplanes sp. N902-109]|uniref:hypothetical protein n=1 Tax=Actinoplanes sp. (strain N902-109) TaxID=649831 RepID=UPI0012F8371C|nr:hypothetical protein [Actinoplanes sp. N902-109]
MDSLDRIAGALLVALIVQIFVIPKIQQRNRQIERWEENMTALVTLLEEELPVAIRAWRSAIAALDGVKDGMAENPNLNEQLVIERFLKPAQKRMSETAEVVDALLARSRLLYERVSLVHRSAPYWRRLYYVIVGIEVASWDVDIRYRKSEDTGTTDQWKDFDQRRRDAVTMLREVSDRMKPPKTYPSRRATRWIKDLPKRIRERRNARQLDAGEPAAVTSPGSPKAQP